MHRLKPADQTAGRWLTLLRRIGLLGWSNGGSTVLASTNLQHRAAAAAALEAFLRRQWRLE